MGSGYWIKRTIKVFCLFFAVISEAHVLRGHAIGDAALFGLTWASLSTAIFTVSRVYQASKGMYCALCNGTSSPYNG
jgi:hypothetical protein